LKTKAYVFKIILTGMITGLCNGLFGAGGGMIAVPSMVHFLDVSEHDAHATAIAVILPLAVISAFVYFRNGFFQPDKVLPVAAGGMLGGLAGAFLLHRVPSCWLRRIFALFMITAAARMIF
jgi:uncharacterized membrane protein YfcA